MNDSWVIAAKSWVTHGQPMGQHRYIRGDPWVAHARPTV